MLRNLKTNTTPPTHLIDWFFSNLKDICEESEHRDVLSIFIPATSITFGLVHPHSRTKEWKIENAFDPSREPLSKGPFPMSDKSLDVEVDFEEIFNSHSSDLFGQDKGKRAIFETRKGTNKKTWQIDSREQRNEKSLLDRWSHLGAHLF